MYALTCYNHQTYRNTVVSVHKSRRAALVASDGCVADFAQLQLGAGKEIPLACEPTRKGPDFCMMRENGNPDRVTIYKKKLERKLVPGIIYNSTVDELKWDPLLSYDIVYMNPIEFPFEDNEYYYPRACGAELATMIEGLECLKALRDDETLKVSQLRERYPHDFGLNVEPVKVSAPVPIPQNVHQLLALEAISKREEIMNKKRN